MVGKIKFFDSQKGWGFIVDKETKQEYFFHASALGVNKNVVAGDTVQYDVSEGKKGMKAVNVELFKV